MLPTPFDQSELTPRHTRDMVFHMKTTLNIDDGVMTRLRREAARTGRTMSELVETALRGLLQAKPATVELRPLPSFNSGGALVDIADREALYRAMEGR
jgi:plasmid stability protein